MSDGKNVMCGNAHFANLLVVDWSTRYTNGGGLPVPLLLETRVPVVSSGSTGSISSARGRFALLASQFAMTNSVTGRKAYGRSVRPSPSPLPDVGWVMWM
jgi:hypothetical protein